MIKLNKLNKFYNHRKRNEIHVVNNIDLEFPSTGLVCLLGASGSGKTTLLNVIGGLDKLNNGIIEIDGVKVDKYKERVWNYYRNYKFGYIFQNYLLLPDLNVYQNLEFSLKIYNLTREEIDERIDYALQAVGMEKFKYRKPSELSGGQQQRVSIARALVKSPDVYIADEPTGNIDEKNTTQIMGILKKLSKNNLIILVTHERRLAEFYGDRIIELKDGKVVSDYLNSSTGSFNRVDDNNLYLKEYTNESKLIQNVDVNYYYRDEANNDTIKLNVIFENNTYYIHTSDASVNIKFLDRNSEVKVIDSKRPEIRVEDVSQHEFTLPDIQDKKKKRLSIISFVDSLKMAMSSISNLKLIQKVMIFVFFLASIFLTYGLTSYNESFYVDETIFLNYHRDLIEIDTTHIYFHDQLEHLEATTDAEFMLTHNSYMYLYNLFINEFYQRNMSSYLDKAVIYPLLEIDEKQLVAGRLPENEFEVVIDLYLVDQLLQKSKIRNLGLKTPEQFIDLVYNNQFGVFSIVGVVDNNNPCFYMSNSGYKLFSINRRLYNFDIDGYVIYDDVEVKSYELFDESIEITENLKDLQLESNQILVSNSLYRSLWGNHLFIGNTLYDVVGTYATNTVHDTIYLQEGQLDDFYNSSLLNEETLYYISYNKTEDIKKLEEIGYNYNDLYKRDYEDNMVLEKNTKALFYSLLTSIFTMLFLYFIIRSSVISKTYTIGVFRSLGVSRFSILKIFLIEILLITSISSLVGISLLSFVIIRVNMVAKVIYYPLYIPIISFLMTLIMNLLIGILPVLPYLKQTPAQILSRFDI